MVFLPCGNPHRGSAFIMSTKKADTPAAKTQPRLKLVYFNGRGRGEISRIMLAEADLKYEDSRVEHKDWEALKPKTPNGQLPLLEVDGFMLPQSGAIERYVARLAKLDGASAWESALVDAVCEGLKDTTEPLSHMHGKKDDEKKVIVEAFFKDHFPKWAAILEKTLTSNNGGNGYFVGNDVTLADIHAYVALSDCVAKSPSCLVTSPKLTALLARVAARPRIAAWFARRPASGW